MPANPDLDRTMPFSLCLQALFRPMSMMIPDYALVAEVMLFSEGFEDSKTLSRKMVKLYKLSSEQLSQQVGGRRWLCGRCRCRGCRLGQGQVQCSKGGPTAAAVKGRCIAET